MFAIARLLFVQLVFGMRWLPVLIVYPFMALGALAHELFNKEVSGLWVLRQNGNLLGIHLVLVCLCHGAAFLGRSGKGPAGFGSGELAAVVNHPFLHARLSRRIGPLRPGVAAGWAIRFGGTVLVIPPGKWMAQPLMGGGAPDHQGAVPRIPGPGPRPRMLPKR